MLENIRNDNQGVSPVIAILIMICLVMALVASIYVMTSSMMPAAEGDSFWELIHSRHPGMPDPTDPPGDEDPQKEPDPPKDPDPPGDDDDDTGEIITDLHCPCDLYIEQISTGKGLGYQTPGEDRALTSQIANAQQTLDSGGAEEYKFTELVDTTDANDFKYHIKCFDDGSYTFSAQYITNTGTLEVTATDITIEDGITDSYRILWTNPPTVFFSRDGCDEIELGPDIENDDIPQQDIDIYLDVTVEISDLVYPGVTRCITLTLWNQDNPEITETIKQEITFNEGTGQELILVSSDQYDAISAKDHLHTIRRTLFDISLNEYTYKVTFTNDDNLISGDINDDNLVDILDFGACTGLIGKSYETGDTTCDMNPVHADLSGERHVSSLDRLIIQNNFLQIGDDIGGRSAAQPAMP